MTGTPDDDDAALVAAVNSSTGAGLTFGSRSPFGQLGGAILVDWPDGRPAVLTVFHGPESGARATADTLNALAERGLPVPRHDLVVRVGDRVVFVQQRLPSAPPSRLTPRRIDALVEINDRFADAAVDLDDVPPISSWFQPSPRQHPETSSPRIRAVVDRIDELTTKPKSWQRLAGNDIVHVDLSPVNVLFDADDNATVVVDWNLGIFRGDRNLALVQTRFDREWFVRRPDADPTETAAARHLDAVLAARVDPFTLRAFWAFWLRRHLSAAIRNGDQAVVDWQLDLAESRLG